MLYSKPTLQPDVPLSYEKERTTMLRFLAQGCWLEDTVPQDSADDPNVVLPKHQPTFSAEGNENFAFPDPAHVNRLVTDGLVSVQLSPWKLNDILGVRQNLRSFILTGKGRGYLEAE